MPSSPDSTAIERVDLSKIATIDEAIATLDVLEEIDKKGFYLQGSLLSRIKAQYLKKGRKKGLEQWQAFVLTRYDKGGPDYVNKLMQATETADLVFKQLESAIAREHFTEQHIRDFRNFAAFCRKEQKKKNERNKTEMSVEALREWGNQRIVESCSYVFEEIQAELDKQAEKDSPRSPSTFLGGCIRGGIALCKEKLFPPEELELSPGDVAIARVSKEVLAGLDPKVEGEAAILKELKGVDGKVVAIEAGGGKKKYRVKSWGAAEALLDRNEVVEPPTAVGETVKLPPSLWGKLIALGFSSPSSAIAEIAEEYLEILATLNAVEGEATQPLSDRVARLLGERVIEVEAVKNEDGFSWMGEGD